MTLDAHEFIRRFLLHVIPKGFVRVRHFGFLANRSKSLLAKCRQLLDLDPALPKLPSKSVQELMLQLTGIDITRCPLCQKGTLVFLAGLPVPDTMGFFVMIDQRTKNRVPAPLCARAHASVRPVSLLHVLLADISIAFRYPVATNRCVKDCPVFSRPTVLLRLLRPISSVQSP